LLARRDLKGSRRDRVLPAMDPILNRYPLLVVITLSVLLAGCQSLFEDPRERANEAIAEANRSIERHNELFSQARDTYSEVKEQVESGADPSKEAERVTEAKETLEEARGNLEDAREALTGIRELEVDPTVKDYARTLSEAMDAQLTAEAREIEFYEILEDDPALEDRREEALAVLEEVGEGYRRAEAAYERAREIADSNPEVIMSGAGETTG
jgi:DNA repair exonuclease SbcCD ATPase subunit